MKGIEDEGELGGLYKISPFRKNVNHYFSEYTCEEKTGTSDIDRYRGNDLIHTYSSLLNISYRNLVDNHDKNLSLNNSSAVSYTNSSCLEIILSDKLYNHETCANYTLDTWHGIKLSENTSQVTFLIPYQINGIVGTYYCDNTNIFLVNYEDTSRSDVFIHFIGYINSLYCSIKISLLPERKYYLYSFDLNPNLYFRIRQEIYILKRKHSVNSYIHILSKDDMIFWKSNIDCSIFYKENNPNYDILSAIVVYCAINASEICYDKDNKYIYIIFKEKLVPLSFYIIYSTCRNNFSILSTKNYLILDNIENIYLGDMNHTEMNDNISLRECRKSERITEEEYFVENENYRLNPKYKMIRNVTKHRRKEFPKKSGELACSDVIGNFFMSCNQLKKSVCPNQELNSNKEKLDRKSRVNNNIFMKGLTKMCSLSDENKNKNQAKKVSGQKPNISLKNQRNKCICHETFNAFRIIKSYWTLLLLCLTLSVATADNCPPICYCKWKVSTCILNFNLFI